MNISGADLSSQMAQSADAALQGENFKELNRASSLFPAEPLLQHFVAASFDDVRSRISQAFPGIQTDISTIWGTPAFTGITERGAFRPDKGEFRGTQTDGNDRMPYVGFWLSKPGESRVFLPEGNGNGAVDQSLVDWFQSAGIGGEAVRIGNAADMALRLQQDGRALYSCDNYGEQLDPYSVNSRYDFDLVSNKSWTQRLVGKYAPYEEIVDMFKVELTHDLFERVRGNSSTIYVKLCNDEHGGMGVKPVTTLAELKLLVGDHQRHTQQNNLNHELVLQRGAEGTNRSFCFLIDGRDDIIPIIGLTDQMVDAKTGRDLGNRHYPITPDAIRPLTGMIAELRTNILANCPHAFGLVMCDFLHDKDGTVVAIDPGLRPSASTPSAMAQLWTKEANQSESYVRNNQCFRFSPGFDWAAFTKVMGSLTDPAVIQRTGLGIVPFSWEQQYGTGRTITIAKNEAQHNEMLRDVARLCGDAFL